MLILETSPQDQASISNMLSLESSVQVPAFEEGARLPLSTA